MHLSPSFFARLRRIFLGGALLACLSGCIVVQYFGGYWEKGFDDPCVQRIAANTLFAEDAGMIPIAQRARSLLVGRHNFLMVREKSEDSGGMLYRYEITGGQYITYRLNESKREEFQREHEGSDLATVTEETATIPVLNENSIALLAEIADKPDYWIEVERRPYNPGNRTDCAVDAAPQS